MRYCWPHVTKQTAASAAEWRARVVQHPYDIVAHLNAQTRLMDLRSDLKRIPCPVLVVVGHDDPMTSPQAANEIADAIGRDRARVRVIGDAAHTVLLDQPQLTHTTIAEFLTEVGVTGVIT
jgi:pimeloyl-ACP methyl ester carboxylesterase